MEKTKTKKILVWSVVIILPLTICVPPAYASTAIIIITEIGAFESSGKEWVEIFNRGSESVDISNWSFLENDTNHGLVVIVGDGILEPEEYALIVDDSEEFQELYPDISVDIFDSSWTSLKESGEEIGLVNEEKEIEELFSYISSPDTALQRIDSTEDIYDDSNWEPHPESGTPGRENEFEIVEEPEEIEEEDEEVEIIEYNEGSVVINELISDPSEGEEEWIELVNTTSDIISLDGWYVQDTSSSKEYLSGNIFPDEYILISSPAFKLNNTGDTVTLYSPDGTEIHSVSYGEDAYPVPEDPYALARDEEGYFQLTEMPTPREANRIIVTQEEVEEEEEVEDVEEPKEQLSFSELFINPEGSDRNEWIEVENTGETDIDLGGYKIVDKEKVSYTFSTKVLKPREYAVVSKQDSGITLNNERAETLKLYSPTEEEIDRVSYKKDVLEGVSLSRFDDSWEYTTTKTPGELNIYTEPNLLPVLKADCPKKLKQGELFTCDVSDTYDPNGDILTFLWEWEGNETVTDVFMNNFPEGEYEILLHIYDDEEVVTKTFTLVVGDPKEKKEEVEEEETVEEYPFVGIRDIRNVEKGKKIRTQGVVTVPQNIFGKTIAYIDGLLLSLSSTGTWPALQIGDHIMLEGTISRAQGPQKLNVKKESINLVEEGVISEPVTVSLSQLSDMYVNTLITVSGEIVDKDGSCIGVMDESEEEVKVCFKSGTGISSSLYKEGDAITVTGMVSKDKDGVIQVFPRISTDIISTPSNPVIDEEIILSEGEEVPQHQKSATTQRYLLIALSAVIMGLVGVVVKSKISK